MNPHTESAQMRFFCPRREVEIRRSCQSSQSIGQYVSQIDDVDAEVDLQSINNKQILEQALGTYGDDHWHQHVSGTAAAAVIDV